jgi:hypothetical protein
MIQDVQIDPSNRNLVKNSIGWTVQSIDRHHIRCILGDVTIDFEVDSFAQLNGPSSILIYLSEAISKKNIGWLDSNVLPITDFLKSAYILQGYQKVIIK